MTSHYLVLSGKSSKFNFWTCKTIVFTGFPEDGSIKSAQYPESCNDSQISVAPFMNWKSKQHPLKCNVFLHSGNWWYFQKFTITFQVDFKEGCLPICYLKKYSIIVFEKSSGKEWAREHIDMFRLTSHMSFDVTTYLRHFDIRHQIMRKW